MSKGKFCEFCKIVSELISFLIFFKNSSLDTSVKKYKKLIIKIDNKKEDISTDHTKRDIFRKAKFFGFFIKIVCIIIITVIKLATQKSCKLFINSSKKLFPKKLEKYRASEKYSFGLLEITFIMIAENINNIDS